MHEDSSHQSAVDLSHVEDPHVRRALRAMHQELTASLQRQQVGIDAMLEMLLDKNLSSIGEFKRYLAKAQQQGHKSQRMHEAMASVALPAAPSVPAPAAAAQPRQRVDEEDDGGRKVYRL